MRGGSRYVLRSRHCRSLRALQISFNLVYSMRMQILVAGRNAKVLATTAGAFADDLVIETAATIADCMALLERTEFDLIIACETLSDGSGLEVLSHAAVNTPDTLRIFAARPSTLEVLKGELGLFGLFRTLSYPINFRKLWAALDLARSCCADQKHEPEAEQEPVVLQVRGPSPGVRAPRAASADAAVQRAPSAGATVARTGAGANGRTAAASGVGGVAANGRTSGASDGGAAVIGGTSAVGRAGRPTADGRTTASSSRGAAGHTAAAVNGGAGARTADRSRSVQGRQVARAASAEIATQRSPRAQTTAAAHIGTAANGSTTAPSVGAAATHGADVNGGASAQIANPSQRVQARLAAMVSAGAVAQPAPNAAVRTVRTTSGAGSDTGSRAAAAAAARKGAAVNGGRAAHAAAPSRQTQSRQGVPARATPTAAQRAAHIALARPAGATAAASSGTVPRGARAAATGGAVARGATAGAVSGTAVRDAGAAAVSGMAVRDTSATAVSGTVARGASAGSARTGAVVNNGRAAHAASSSRQVASRQNVQARATPAQQASARVPVTNTSQRVQPRQVAASQDTPASRRAAAAAQRNATIPQTEAFKRALAKRNASKLESNADMSTVDVLGADRQSNETGERRREPRMSNDSLAQLARLTLTGRPTYDSRGKPRGKKRAAFFVGSGVFAAATAAVLTFFMLNENNSMGRSRLPLVASMERPVSQKVFPWQPAPQQPTGTMPFRSEASASAVADFEVQAEAASDASAVEPGHPPPPPPNPPPPPAEPPSADSPGWVDE